MSITKSNTKEEILKALDAAIDEQSLLHKEVENLQTKFDVMKKNVAEKDTAIMNFENQIVNEDIKKKGLITQLASQTTDIELARQKTKKYVELKKELASVTEELEAVKVKLLAKEKEVECLEEELTKPKTESKSKGGFFRPFLKVAAACSVIFVAVVAINLFIDTKISPITHAKYDNGVVAMSLDPNILTLTEKDGELGITGVDAAVAKWAEKAGYDGIMYGKILKTDEGKIVVTTADVYDYVTVDINKFTKKFEVLECNNILALVDNPDNIILPEPFTTSKGNLKFYEGRRKLASFFPVFWGKDKRVFNINSDNVSGFISSTGIFMKVEDIKAVVSFGEVEVKEDVTEMTKIVVSEIVGKMVDKASEVEGVDFSKAEGWMDKMKNLWSSE